MNIYEEMKNNAFKPIESPIILNFSKCTTLGELHEVLKTKFGFPEYYGENWDALWDCLDGLFHNRGDFTIEIHGFYFMDLELQEYCQTMLEIFENVHRKTPNVVFHMIDCNK